MYDWVLDILDAPAEPNIIVLVGALVCFVLTLACVLKLFLKVFGI